MEEAAAYSRTSRSTVSRAVSAGRLRAHGVNPGSKRSVRLFRAEDLDAWIMSGAPTISLVPTPVSPRSRARRHG
jgi:excisionase family DNA binding protein